MEIHQKAFELPIFANWREAQKLSLVGRSRQRHPGGEPFFVASGGHALAAYCEATRGGVVARLEITRWRGDGREGGER